jgi:aerobic-type carbon monoxide dehydrogenase small subunit (CoxS/CutS family)
MTDKRTISVTVNGAVVEREIETRTTLVDFLRHDLELTGTHVGCEHGVCGACTVLVDGKSARACLMLAVQCNGRKVSTVEGLATDGVMNTLQQAFQDNHALQCGFCTSGILMTLTEFLRDRKHQDQDPNEAEVNDILSGNLCRCTGYRPIIKATLDAAKKMRESI